MLRGCQNQQIRNAPSDQWGRSIGYRGQDWESRDRERGFLRCRHLSSGNQHDGAPGRYGLLWATAGQLKTRRLGEEDCSLAARLGLDEIKTSVHEKLKASIRQRIDELQPQG